MRPARAPLRTMRPATLLLPFLLAALPAMAGFAPQQLAQTIKLRYGQNAITVIFHTADGSTVTKARPLCDCTRVRLEGTRLMAEVDTSTFDTSVDKQIDVTTSDGQRSTLTMHFDVPQAVHISSPSLIWEKGSEPQPQVLRLTIPKGSPVRALLSADLAGDAFDYRAETIAPGREYAITVTPRSTTRRSLNRLVINMDGSDPRYTRRIVYLRVR